MLFQSDWDPLRLTKRRGSDSFGENELSFSMTKSPALK